jgi:hypothetical protein
MYYIQSITALSASFVAHCQGICGQARKRHSLRVSLHAEYPEHRVHVYDVPFGLHRPFSLGLTQILLQFVEKSQTGTLTGELSFTLHQVRATDGR